MNQLIVFILNYHSKVYVRQIRYLKRGQQGRCK